MTDQLFLHSESDLTYVACDLCGSDATQTLFEKDGFTHVKCRNCGLVYVNPRLKDPLEHQETFYDNLKALHNSGNGRV